MLRRIELQGMLESILGSRNVYYQAPPDYLQDYPAIVYEPSDKEPKYADNGLYNTVQCYTVTVIDPNPDSAIPNIIETLPMCRYDRHFVSNNKHHTVFTLYY